MAVHPFEMYDGWRAAAMGCSSLLPPRRLEDLINMLPAVFVRRLEIVQLLVETRDIRFELCRLGGEPRLYTVDGRKHEPLMRICERASMI